MITLGIETSVRVGSLALVRDERCVEEVFLPELSRRHAWTLVPELMTFLERHGVRATDIELIAVSAGPGSFTGLRVGVSCAKTLAYAVGAKLAAVDTFAAIAENTPGAEGAAVIADAQRRGVMLGMFARASRGEWEQTSGLSVVRREELASRLEDVDLVSGPGLVGLDRELLGNVPIAPRALWLPRAAMVARLGERRSRRGELADPFSLEPQYARRSAAEEQWEKREAGRVKGSGTLGK